jgi:hypothetical protein
VPVVDAVPVIVLPETRFSKRVTVVDYKERREMVELVLPLKGLLTDRLTSNSEAQHWKNCSRRRMEGNNSEPVPLTTEERKSLMEEREVPAMCQKCFF